MKYSSTSKASQFERPVKIRTYYQSYSEETGRCYWNKIDTRIINLDADSVFFEKLMQRRIVTDKSADGLVKYSYVRLFDPMHFAPVKAREEGEKIGHVSIE